jgi:hypothetical protein
MKKNDKVYLVFWNYGDGIEQIVSPVGFLTKAGAKKFLKGHIESYNDDLIIVESKNDVVTVRGTRGKKPTWYYRISWIRVF